MNTKQVIIMRKDLKIRRGKEIAQGSHGSMAWLTRRIQFSRDDQNGTYSACPTFTQEEISWMENSFTKVCLQVDSEQELLDIYQKAKEEGLTVSLITDAGRTEFAGVPTNTCVAIGPHESSKIDKVCSHLKLY